MRAGTLEEERWPHRRLRLQRPRLACARCWPRTPGEIACLVLEAATALAEPAPGFLEGLRALADERRLRPRLRRDDHRHALVAARGPARLRRDARTCRRGARRWATGSRSPRWPGAASLMELGGLRTDAPRVFLLSTTHGPETAGLAAYLAVEQAYRERDVVGEMERQGRRSRTRVSRGRGAAGLERLRRGRWAGRPAWCSPPATPEGHPSQAYRTLFLQELHPPRRAGPVLRDLGRAHRRRPRRHRRGGGRAPCRSTAGRSRPASVDGLLAGRPVAPALRTHARAQRWADHRHRRSPRRRATVATASVGAPCRFSSTVTAATSARCSSRSSSQAGHEVVGLDAGWYDGCDFGPRPRATSRAPVTSATRRRRTWTGFDAVVHLAAISNDPVGHLNPEATYSVNAARRGPHGARSPRPPASPRFLFSSSCSLYGAAGDCRGDRGERASTR